MEMTPAQPEPAGTPLAEPPLVGPRLSPEAIWQSRRNAAFLAESGTTRLLALGGGLLFQSTMVALLVHAGYPSWRIVALVGLFAGFALGHTLCMRGAHKTPACVEHSFIGMNLVAQLFIVGSATLTGGVHSAFLPGTVLPAIVSLLFFGPQAVSRWIALGNALLILAMLCLPATVVGPSWPGAEYAFGIFIALGWHLFLLHMMVARLAVVANRAGASLTCLREERLEETEAQLRRLQSVGAKVAHELKNPLASIKGLCQLVARTPESERTQERLTVVAAEIARMETILNEYLSFSRPLEDLEPQQLDLTDVARDVLDTLDGRAEQAGVALALEGNATPVSGDPRRLKEALINLVANAIEATPTGGDVTLRVRPQGGATVLEVRDTGRGISAEDLERLGTSFFTTRANGTGLGVVLAQGVIAQHGGTLTYASEVGRGTTATITLPGPASAGVALAPRAALVEARA